MSAIEELAIAHGVASYDTVMGRIRKVEGSAETHFSDLLMSAEEKEIRLQEERREKERNAKTPAPKVS